MVVGVRHHGRREARLAAIEKALRVYQAGRTEIARDHFVAIVEQQLSHYAGEVPG